jgi:hypothetical protein
MTTELRMRNNLEAGSYDAMIEGKAVGMVVYRLRGKRAVITHTVVDPDYRGNGIATELVQFALDDIAAKNLSLTNYCSFVAEYIADHPSYKDLIDNRLPGSVAVPPRPSTPSAVTSADGHGAGELADEARRVQLIARHVIKPGEEAAVLAALPPLVAAARAEPGNLAFEVFRSVDDDRSYVLLERYTSRDALAAHRETPHFQRYLIGEIAPRLAQRVIEEYDVPGRDS